LGGVSKDGHDKAADKPPRSRGRTRPELLQELRPSDNRGRRECRVLQPAPTASRAIEKEHTSIVTTGESRITGIPCAMVLTVSFALFPGTGLCCPRHRRIIIRELDTSVGVPEPHDFAVRISAFVSRAVASIASRAQHS
jgi:hypothetical protein